MITNKNEDKKQPVWLHETNCIYAFTRKTYQIMSDVDHLEIDGIQYPTKAIEETLCFLKPKRAYFGEERREWLEMLVLRNNLRYKYI